MPTKTDMQPTIGSGDLQGTVSSATMVTNYSQASITAVPQLQGTQDWLQTIQANITTAQNNAQNWLSNLCPAINQSIPQSIIDYNANFQSAAATILGVLTDIDNQGTPPTPVQQATIDSQLGSLSTALDNQSTNAQQLLGQLASFTSNLNNDQNILAADLNTASTKYTDGAEHIRQVSAVIAQQFLNSNLLGPCNCIVMVDMNVTIEISNIGCDPDLVSIIFIKNILETQIGNVQTAQKAAQLVLDSWNIINTKIKLVITALNNTAADGYVPFIEELDLANAQTLWQQLASYAQSILPTP